MSDDKKIIILHVSDREEIPIKDFLSDQYVPFPGHRNSEERTNKGGAPGGHLHEQGKR